MADQPVGREGESEQLDAFLEQRHDRLLVALLVGDPGIGKSTLWQRSIRSARERSLTILISRPAERERDLPYLVLGDLFRDVPPAIRAALPAARRRALEAALLLGEQTDAPMDQRALGVAVASVLDAHADAGPVVIAIDDDQWIDPASSDVLAFAIRRLGHRPIRLLLARRARTRPPIRLESLADSGAVARIEVGPLSLGATQLLLRDRLGFGVSRPTLRELHRAAAGNPFHALELGRARSTDATRDLDLPLLDVTVDDLLRARLRALDGATSRALLLVAAHGRTPGALLALLDVPAEVTERAVEAGLLESSSGSFGFTHPLFAAAVYGRATAEARRDAHRQLAHAIPDEIERARHVGLGQIRPNDSVAADLEAAAELARGRGRLVAAADLAERAAALTPAEAPDDRFRRTLAAARTRLEAGDGRRGQALISSLLRTVPAGPQRAEVVLLAADQEAPAAAMAMLEGALRDAGADPRLRASIHASLAAAGRLVRGRSWAERHVTASLRLSATIGDDGLRARALSSFATLRFEAAEPDALDLALQAYGLAAPAGDPAVVREAVTTVGHILTWWGETDRARAWLTDQLATWRDRDEMLQADCLWYLSLVELQAGNLAAAEARATESSEIRAQYSVELPQDHLPAALIALHRGEFDRARQHAERALSLANGMLLTGHLGVLATIELWTGEPIRAIEGFERAEAAAARREFREPAMRIGRADHGEALLRAGRISEAERLAEDWEQTARRVGRRRELAGATRLRGLIALARGDLATATAILADAAEQHASAGDRFGWARARLAAGVTQVRLRHKRLARIAFEEAAAEFEALGASSWLAETRGELARLGGRRRIEGLSPSERRVAELVATGRSNRDIAAALFVTERTVASHLTHIYAKLGVSSRTQLVRVLNRAASNVPTF